MVRYKDTNYYVTKGGQIISMVRKKPKLMKQQNVKGYRQVPLMIEGRKVATYVHRMVAWCYLENPLNKEYVNHINSIKSDNRVENLEWCTAQENMNHMVASNRQSKGVDRPDAKLTELDVIEIRRLYVETKTSYRKLGKLFNIDYKNIEKIIKKQSWKHV